MLRKWGIPLSYGILLACAVYPNRAVIDPWGYAPSSPSQAWASTEESQADGSIRRIARVIKSRRNPTA